MHFTDVTQTNEKQYTITKPGRYVFFVCNQSADIRVSIASQGVEAFILGLYIGKGKESFELYTTQHHATGNSSSDLLIKGAFFDESKFIYEGLIKIDKNAQKSHAYQKNQNLMMSDSAFIDSRPFLEILANDVFCTHGSTTGRLDKEQLYYLETRSISKQEGEKILIAGFFHEVFHRIRQLQAAHYTEAYKNFIRERINI